MLKRILRQNNERGAVLIVGLMILLILTLLGVTAMQSTSLEEKMSRNQRLRDMAFQAAEAGLISGETLLQDATLPSFGSSTGLYSGPPTPAGSDPRWKTFDQSGWTNNSLAGDTQSFSTTDQAAFKVTPLYYIEDMGKTPSGSQSLSSDTAVDTSEIYRVTARGTVTSGSQVIAEVILQSTFVR